MAGKQFISDVHDRDRVNGEFLVQQKTVPLNKNGKPYIALVVMDRTGSMEARVWDNVDALEGQFEAGDYIELGGVAVAYQGRVQLKVERLRRLDPEAVESEDFLPASKRDRGEMLARLRKLLSSIDDETLREFVLGCLEDAAFREVFLRAPAAKSIHHAFLGGLLEHTLSVVELADRVAPHYPTLDRNLLLAGAFFHDVGKVRELGRDRSFEYTDEGRLIGHIVMGAQMITDWADKFGRLSQDQRMRLVHLVVSHHGSYEFGSPKQPMFAEALLLNFLDDLDSKLQAFREVAERESGQRWSSFQKPFDRYLYLGEGLGDSETEPEPAEPPTSPTAPLSHKPMATLRRRGAEERRPVSPQGTDALDLFGVPPKNRES